MQGDLINENIMQADISYFHHNLNTIETLNGFTHVFAFDSVFLPDDHDHLINLVTMSSTVKWFITFKGRKFKRMNISTNNESGSWEYVGKVTGKLCGSNETKTGSVFKRELASDSVAIMDKLFGSPTSYAAMEDVCNNHKRNSVRNSDVTSYSEVNSKKRKGATLNTTKPSKQMKSIPTQKRKLSSTVISNPFKIRKATDPNQRISLMFIGKGIYLSISVV